MLRAPSTSSGNANSSECWSPLMSGSANAICNADGTSKMLSCQNMFMAKGKLVLTPNLSNNRCSCCGSQPDEYRLPVASIRNCDSLSAPPTPATTEKFNKRAQDKQPSSEVIELVEEWGRGENQMAKEVSLYQSEMKRLRSDKDIPVLNEETPDRLIRVENSSTDRETKAIDLLGTPNKRPQRKKHRPKVFKEGNPSRTPKLATSPSDMDGSSCKRKYVRRNKDVIHSSEKENTSCRRKYARRSKDVAHSSNTNAFEEIIETESKGKAKYSRRCLNFDSEEPQAMEEFSAAMLVFKKVLGDRSHHEVASCHPQNALVPYAGHGFMMVPYDRSFELVKRRRPRAKVDLDPESNRVWKLLMGKDCGEGGEPPDVDKEKWWDEERRVFQGRVDSFIARMHLVQGDRRYSQWKGSVVDSVVGVFLTQNVSDHLSSSAFMSLAANFPLSSRDKFSVPETERVNTSMESQNRSLFDNGLFFQSSVEFSGSQNGEEKEISNCSEILRSTTRNNIIYYSRKKGKGICVNHKNIASDAKYTSKNENLEVRVSLEKEVMIRFQQKDENSIFKEERTRDSVQPSDEPCGNQQAAVSNNQIECNFDMPDKVGPNLKAEICNFPKTSPKTTNSAINTRKTGKSTYDWESLRKEICCSKPTEERNSTTMDSLDWEAVRTADVSKVAEAIRARGMNNVLAERIQAFLNRLVREHGSIDLEWLRDVSPDKVKDYLLSIRGLGLKSAECVRLLTLRQLAFPVDTNVGRICVRLGWVPLQPLPESLQLHLLELYPVLATIQKYLWPRLCKLDQLTLYELHYQMITFGKVFCTKSKPNCNSCPMRGECRHFASAFASARLALPAPEDKSLLSLASPIASDESANVFLNPRPFPQIEESLYSQEPAFQNNCVPIIEEPTSPEPECQESLESAIEDAFYEDPEEIPTIKLNLTEFTQNLQNYMEENMELQDVSLSKALMTLTPEAASIPMPKLKNVSRLRTEHQVYEIPDTHPLLEGLDPREPDDPSPYLLAIWTPGETTQSTEPPKADCNFEDVGQPCERSTCFGCNSMREEESHKIQGTLLIPCRTAMRGSFPLNGTYFQVNEVFADHHSSREPVHVLRDWIWNLPRRTVYFGTSIPTIFKGLTTEGIHQCFWRGFVCVRGFDRVTRAPKPLYARLHFPASKTTKNRNVGEPKVEKK